MDWGRSDRVGWRTERVDWCKHWRDILRGLRSNANPNAYPDAMRGEVYTDTEAEAHSAAAPVGCVDISDLVLWWQPDI